MTYDKEVFIKKNGRLELSGVSSKNLLLESGTHQVKEEHLRHLEFYKTHDSIVNKMKTIGIADCDFNYELYCEPILGGWRTYELGHIEVERDSDVVERLSHDYFAEVDTNLERNILINWTNPDTTYTGKYFILVEHIFKGFSELLETESNSHNFDLVPYIEEPTPLLIFTITAENCRESIPVGLALRTE